MKYFTGVGGRMAPAAEMQLLMELAYKLTSEGIYNRTGGADGADTAVWNGTVKYWKDSPPKASWVYADRLYVPWNGFKGHYVSSKWGWIQSPESLGVQKEAEYIAKQVHTHWGNLKQAGRAFHTRNVLQVLGDFLNKPSDVLICWAITDKWGIPKGGTRTAWVLAKEHKVPCYNLFLDKDRKKMMQYLGRKD